MALRKAKMEQMQREQEIDQKEFKDVNDGRTDWRSILLFNYLLLFIIVFRQHTKWSRNSGKSPTL